MKASSFWRFLCWKNFTQNSLRKLKHEKESNRKNWIWNFKFYFMHTWRDKKKLFWRTFIFFIEIFQFFYSYQSSFFIFEVWECLRDEKEKPFLATLWILYYLISISNAVLFYLMNKKETKHFAVKITYKTQVVKIPPHVAKSSTKPFKRTDF